MSDTKNTTRVDGLVVSVTKIPTELKTTNSGKIMFKAGAVRETDSGEKVWVDLLAFGLLARNLNNRLKKGARVKIFGNLKESEYTKTDGTVGVNKAVFLNRVQIAGDDGLVTIDEFSGSESPF